MNRFNGICFLLMAMLFACDRKPYVEHKLKFEKVSDNCQDQQSYFRMTSNFGGERYEFEKCLPADFKKDQLITERAGDTIYVHFKTEGASGASHVFHLVLDIDSYPRYRYLTIGADTYSISPVEK